MARRARRQSHRRGISMMQVAEMFAGRHNVGEKDTLAQMQHVVAALVGQQLMYKGSGCRQRRSAMAD